MTSNWAEILPKYLSQGDTAAQSGDYRKAIEFYTAGITEASKDRKMYPPLYHRRVQVYVHLGQWIEALKDSETCLQFWTKERVLTICPDSVEYVTCS